MIPTAEETRRLAWEKVLVAPWPTDEDVAAVARSKLFSARKGGELRGNARDRASRKTRLLDEFGDGWHCRCVYCGRKLDWETLTQDRIIPGCVGGRYRLSNLLPACRRCNGDKDETKGARARLELIIFRPVELVAA